MSLVKNELYPVGYAAFIKWPKFMLLLKLPSRTPPRVWATQLCTVMPQPTIFLEPGAYGNRNCLLLLYNTIKQSCPKSMGWAIQHWESGTFGILYRTHIEHKYILSKKLFLCQRHGSHTCIQINKWCRLIMNIYYINTNKS